MWFVQGVIEEILRPAYQLFRPWKAYYLGVIYNYMMKTITITYCVNVIQKLDIFCLFARVMYIKYFYIWSDLHLFSVSEMLSTKRLIQNINENVINCFASQIYISENI